MKYDLIALDLDGTLLEPDLTILPEVAAALRALREQGVVVTLATGRAFPSAKKYADLLALDCPLICYNGAVVKTAGGELLAETLLPLERMREIIAACEARDWYLQLYNDDAIIVPAIGEHTLADPDYSNMPCREVGPLSAAALQPSPKMMTRCRPDETAHRAAVLQEITGGSLYIAGSTPHLVEIMCNTVGKARALQYLCDRLGIDIARTVACGDGDNDFDLLQATGLGCAMANATDKTKGAAGYICENKNGRGVLEAVRRCFYGG